jgi:hypothetical protein
MEIKQIKINGIVYELPRNVQGNWNEYNPESESYIHNKPFYEYNYTEVVQFTRDNIVPDFHNCVCVNETVRVKPGDTACVELYDGEDSKVLECSNLEVHDVRDDIGLSEDCVCGVSYVDPTQNVDMLVVFGAIASPEDGFIEGNGCVCLLNEAPQEYIDNLASIKVSINGTDFKPLDNKFIQTLSTYNPDDSGPVNARAIEDAINKNVPGTVYNTPYNAETNKAATMADIEAALFIDAEELV